MRVPAATSGSATGARAVASGRVATVLWLLLWGGLGVLSLSQAVTAPGALQRFFTDMAGGQPRWLASADTTLAGHLAQRSATVSLVLAGLLAVIAAAVFLPAPARRLVLGVAAALSVAIWTIGQGFGGILTGMATDPNSGPLLLLVIAAYWPVREVGPPAPRGGRRSGRARSRGWPMVSAAGPVLSVAGRMASAAG